MRDGLAKAEAELAMSYCAALYWAEQDSGSVRCRNGSAFFLNAGDGVFGVTACHVVEDFASGWRARRLQQQAGPLWLAGAGEPVLLEDWDARVIDFDRSIDIATFKVTATEIRQIGKQALTGYQSVWPPAPPQVGRGVFYCGFPGIETLMLSPREASFGLVCGSGVASAVTERDVLSFIDRAEIEPIPGSPITPENFNFGGMSGGPMLSVMETVNGLRLWALAGVLCSGPNADVDSDQAIAGFEMIIARRAHFISPNGRLNKLMWKIPHL